MPAVIDLGHIPKRREYKALSIGERAQAGVVFIDTVIDVSGPPNRIDDLVRIASVDYHVIDNDSLYSPVSAYHTVWNYPFGLRQKSQKQQGKKRRGRVPDCSSM